MIRRMMIIGALVASILVSAASSAPASATSGLADKVSASSVLDSGDVPLYNTTLKIQGLKAEEAAAYASQIHHHKRWRTNRQRGYYEVTHRFARWHWSGEREWGCLVNLWDRESGWNQFAANPYSEAYGIPQANPGYKMSSAGREWRTNPWTQIRWGLRYIHARYGTPCAAWANEQSYGYYAQSAHLMKASTHILPRRIRAYNWAVRNAKGCWYVWAGAGPCSLGYDCSGMVMRAYEDVGIYLPHNTQMMVDSGHLIRISARNARKGDVVMYFGSSGAYHTGLVAYKDRWMLDAPEPGKRVHVERIWGSPAFYRVRK